MKNDYVAEILRAAASLRSDDTAGVSTIIENALAAAGLAGLSAGGAMAAIMGQTYPELYAAIGVHSGLAFGSADDVMSAFTAMRGQAGSGTAPWRSAGGPRTIVFHGSADSTVHPSNAERIVAGHASETGPISSTTHDPAGDTRGYTRRVGLRADGQHAVESWIVEGAQHAWSGGNPSGSYTDPRGPSASKAMVGFFLEGASDIAIG